MREKTSENLIRIDYSNDVVRSHIEAKLDQMITATGVKNYPSKKFHLSGFEDEILPKPKYRKLDSKNYRIIKEKKSKLIRQGLEKHNIRAWTP